MGAGKTGLEGFKNTQGGRENARANAVIHQGKQDKHIEGSNNFKQQVAQGKTPSVLTADPHALLKEAAGRGTPIQNAPNKERFDFGRVIGRYVDSNGRSHDTTRVTIHYDGRGNAHIVPARPSSIGDY